MYCWLPPATSRISSIGSLMSTPAKIGCGSSTSKKMGLAAKLAVTEACSNSVRHAYRDGREGAVQINYELHPDRLVVEVCDDGQGFAIEQSLPVGGTSLTEGGLGIAIIRELADELELGPRDDGQGSRLRLVKFIQA
jgi:anti-sigma regulatory factor (Ser/Thr protein kinase)